MGKQFQYNVLSSITGVSQGSRIHESTQESHLSLSDNTWRYGGEWASLVAQMVKNPPKMGETWVRSLG